MEQTKAEKAVKYLTKNYPEVVGGEFDEISDEMVSVDYVGSTGQHDELKDVPCRYEIELLYPNEMTLQHFVDGRLDFTKIIADFE